MTTWQQTELNREWKIFSEPGDEMTGYEYPTGVGKIDILARHKERPAWPLVELKRDRAADQVLGQVLRYMGWIKLHLAEPGELIQGLIIASDVDRGLMCALQALDGQRIDLMRYRVEFYLEPVAVSKEKGK
jgi:RecB family endonuclease NucS